MSAALLTYHCGHRSVDLVIEQSNAMLSGSKLEASTTLQNAKQRRGGRVTPGGMTQNWATPLLDCALTFEMQNIFLTHAGDISLCWMADATQQRQCNWLNSSYTMVQTRTLQQGWG